METDDVERAKAYRNAVEVSDELEMHEDAPVSLGDSGAFVQTWTWVSNIEAGICITCGDTNADNGEGFDGECGSCSDKTDQLLHPEDYKY